MILDQIIADRKRAVAALKERYSTSQLMGDIEFQNFATLDFKKALKREDEGSINIIAEVKKASPSKGLI